MKKSSFLSMCCAVLWMGLCIPNAGAQDLKSVISGVVKSVVGDKLTTESSIIGTWAYSAPDCQFESESVLAKAGGEVAAVEVEEQLKAVYEKIGMSNCQFTFNEDESYSGTLGSGTYTFDSDAKTITMKTKLGIKTVAYVAVTGSTMSLTFDADKLLSLLKVVVGVASSTSSTLSAITSLADAYDGLRVGFELTKQ